MKKENKVQYIVQKYVMASSLKEALRKEKKTEIHSAWIDKEWIEQTKTQLNPAIGFTTDSEEEGDEYEH